MSKEFASWLVYGVWCNISVISWWSVLLVEENVVPRENHWPVASHWQTSSHNVVSSTSRPFVKKNIQNTE